MLDNDVFDGFIRIEEGILPIHFENNYFEIFLDGMCFTLQHILPQNLLVEKRGMISGYILFHFPFPFSDFGAINVVGEDGNVHTQTMSIGTIRQEPDYYIDHYQPNSYYSKMVFKFPELDYFLPSFCMGQNEPDVISLRKNSEIRQQFHFVYKERPVEFILQTRSIGSQSTKIAAETISELILMFSDTGDMEFLLGLYHLIHHLFSFICNRQNISLEHVALLGQYEHPGLVSIDGKQIIGNKSSPTDQTLVVLNKYKAAPENKKIISKTTQHSIYASALEKLFELIVKDEVSISSIHASLQERNLLDLKHCLQISAAFEHYQRTFLPSVSSKGTLEFYDDLDVFLESYIKTHMGKIKETAKNFKDSLKPNVSLEQKVFKAYNGYNGWTSLSPILNEWFGSDISNLAKLANKWRNELAHEKRSYEPDQHAITATRLLEHINYCIVLRKAGYCDDSIKMILETTLAR